MKLLPIHAIYPLLALMILWGAKFFGRKQWNEEWLSLHQMKMLQGAAAVCIMLHHMAQKTCAPWHSRSVIVHGLDGFVPIGYFFVSLFLFCSGYGLFVSFKRKPDYLRGFFRRRVLPVIAAFYLSEAICWLVRLLMGEKMDVWQHVWYLTGLQLANPNAWYVIALPFFYLFFYLAFRRCKSDGGAIAWVAAAMSLYTLVGVLVDHNNWWMRGEWWYNSVHLFVIGMLAAKYEGAITRFFKRGYWLWLALALGGCILFFNMSVVAQNTISYYCDGRPVLEKLTRRMSVLHLEELASLLFVLFVFLLGLKIRLNNRVLAFFGGITLELYLIHGIFVDLFGYDFFETVKSLVYIKDVPLYVAVVTVCSIPAALLLRWLLRLICPPARASRMPREAQR